MLTEKQGRFVKEYLAQPNATHAAIKAGYSARSAKVEGCRLLDHPKIIEALNEARARRSAAPDQEITIGGVTVSMVMSELAKIGFADIRRVVRWASTPGRVLTDPETDELVVLPGNQVMLVDSDDLDAATAGAISEVSQAKDGTLKVKLHDKRAALVDMGKHLGMFRPGSKPARQRGDQVPPAEDSWEQLLH